MYPSGKAWGNKSNYLLQPFERTLFSAFPRENSRAHSGSWMTFQKRYISLFPPWRHYFRDIKNCQSDSRKHCKESETLLSWLLEWKMGWSSSFSWGNYWLTDPVGFPLHVCSGQAMFFPRGFSHQNSTFNRQKLSTCISKSFFFRSFSLPRHVRILREMLRIWCYII